MKNESMYYGVGIIILLIGLFAYGKFMQTNNEIDKIYGITVVAPPKKFKDDPMPAIRQVNAEWVALVPYAYTSVNIPEVHFGTNSWQWWGEKEEGIIECIKYAKKNGLKIMLKPQVYVPGSWTGDLNFTSEQDWLKWEQAYEEYIMTFLKIAIRSDVEMFCIGTEFVKSSELRTKFWIQLIEKIRLQYNGYLTYSDNWDHYAKISFWDRLDFIGISAYFPIVEGLNPDVEQLKQGWVRWKNEMQQFSKNLNKKILFTEYGYLSVNGAAGKSWELEKDIEQRFINEKAQADAFEALFSALYDEKWWAGGFIWKWFPEGMGHEGYPERDYTPQSKIAEKVISHWYSKN
ncbi:MAG: hypothetical protein HOP11_13180 [Saprospiraceae bacterium]|nr:hypothetical protein [Saprospiraceae bacterium]